MAARLPQRTAGPAWQRPHGAAPDRRALPPAPSRRGLQRCHMAARPCRLASRCPLRGRQRRGTEPRERPRGARGRTAAPPRLRTAPRGPAPPPPPGRDSAAAVATPTLSSTANKRHPAAALQPYRARGEPALPNGRQTHGVAGSPIGRGGAAAAQ